MSTMESDRAALAAAVTDLLDDLSSDTQVRAAVGEHGGVDEKLWPRLVDMGVLELAAPSFRRQASASLLDLVMVFEALGRFLAPVPALSTAVALCALDECADPVLRGWSEDLAAGRKRVALAISVGDDLASPAAGVTLDETARVRRLSGALGPVADDGAADAVLVLAPGGDRSRLFLVPTAGPHITFAALQAFDLSRPMVEVTLDGAVGIEVSPERADLVPRLLQVAWLLLAAEQVGVAQRALDSAVSYAKLRTQFGRAIGSFQAIKHSCVDMLIQVEGGRELVRAAAAAMDVRDRGAKDDGGDAIAIAVNVAVAYMAEAAIDCSQRCLQIHGGIGFTWEHGAHLGLRKARTNAALLSHTSAHWQAVTEGLHRQAAAEAR